MILRKADNTKFYGHFFVVFAFKVCVKGKLLPFTFPLRAGDRWFRAAGLSPL